MVGKGKEAAQCLDRADRIESTGDQSGSVTDGANQEELKKMYLERTGIDIGSQVGSAQVAAAVAALKRADRQKADTTATDEQKHAARLVKIQERRRRRGR